MELTLFFSWAIMWIAEIGHSKNYVKTLTFKEEDCGPPRTSMKQLKYLLESFGQLVKPEFMEEDESYNSNYEQLHDYS